jgi:4-methylaminobutanoate oxidase (formaldehyde-forming)
MGPDSARIAAEVGAPELNDIGYFKHGEAHIAGHHVRAARLSYVGEAGWEITCRSENAPAIYAALTAAGAKPAGLYAQTSMRVEKAFCAMGHELDSDLTPVETGLDAMTRKAGGFIGAEAIAERKAAGKVSKVLSLTLEDETAVPLGHEPVLLEGEILGQTSTCAFGYRVGKPIALAHVERPVETGTTVQIDIAGEIFNAVVTNGPLFDPEGRRMRPS